MHYDIINIFFIEIEERKRNQRQNVPVSRTVPILQESPWEWSPGTGQSRPPPGPGSRSHRPGGTAGRAHGAVATFHPLAPPVLHRPVRGGRRSVGHWAPGCGPAAGSAWRGKQGIDSKASYIERYWHGFCCLF